MQAKQSRPSQNGLSLPELLVYTLVLGILAVGISAGVEYFQEKQISIQKSTVNRQELQKLALELQVIGQNTKQTSAAYASPSPSGNHCIELIAGSPTGFDALFFNNAAQSDAAQVAKINFAATSSGSQSGSNWINDSALFASNGTLALQQAGGSNPQTSTITRTVSVWFKVGVTANAVDVLDYAPAGGLTNPFKIKIGVENSPSRRIRVDLGLGLNPFYFTHTNNILDGSWNHMLVEVSGLSGASAPRLYLNGAQLSTTTQNVPSQVPTGAYKLQLGGQTSTQFFLGPTAIFSRALSSEEKGKVLQPGKHSLDSLADTGSSLIRQRWTTGDANKSSDVSEQKIVDNRERKVFLLAQSAGSASGYDSYNLFMTDSQATCLDPNSTQSIADITNAGYRRLSDLRCFVRAGQEPILSGDGGGITNRCQFGAESDRPRLESGRGPASVADSDSLSARVSTRSDGELCKLPIRASDFSVPTNESETDTAYVIMEDFDISQDMLAFGDADWPPNERMPDTSSNNAGVSHTAGIPAGITATWFGYPNNQVGMFRLTRSGDADKNWWVDNVFLKVKYKSKSAVGGANRKIVFVLGPRWPIKTCSNLPYRSSYHFYSLQSSNTAMTSFAAYRDAYRTQPKYFGMTGYVGNMRCVNEKDQVVARVLPSGNNRAIIGGWGTWQTSSMENSIPTFLPRSYNSVTRQRERVTFSSNRFFTANDTWTDTPTQRESDGGNPFTSDVTWRSHYGPDCQNCNAHTATDQNNNDGNVQWRWIGGPSIDHNVIFHTDHTTCNANATDENKKKGCRGMNRVTTAHPDISADDCENIASNRNKVSCLLKTQRGGDTHYGWWEPGEPNETGAFLWMGYSPNGGENYWDDAGRSTAHTTTLSQVNSSTYSYLLEYGSHPWDATIQTDSPYVAALRNDARGESESRTRLDPPNIASKTVSTLNQQYCK